MISGTIAPKREQKIFQRLRAGKICAANFFWIGFHHDERPASRESTFGIVQQFLQARTERGRDSLPPACVHKSHVHQIAEMHAVFVAERSQFHPHQRVE